jgi:hypothetical protein
MSDEVKDGGPAFPFGENRYDGGNHYLGKQYAPGMSLRDWFAGQALAHMVSGSAVELPSWQHVAAACYDAADAMLSARQHKDENDGR